jgi:hypothetical protein
MIGERKKVVELFRLKIYQLLYFFRNFCFDEMQDIQAFLFMMIEITDAASKRINKCHLI